MSPSNSQQAVGLTFGETMTIPFLIWDRLIFFKAKDAVWPLRTSVTGILEMEFKVLNNLFKSMNLHSENKSLKLFFMNLHSEKVSRTVFKQKLKANMF